MKPLIDADILRYELGFAAEVAWRGIKEDPEVLPPFDFVREMLHDRIESIKEEVEADEPCTYYLTGDTNFRFDLATVKPYKGTRKGVKPWHFDNLTVYMRDVLNAVITDGIEADDLITVDHLASGGSTIICSRDKDLRQVPGWFYSWELGKQAQFGPYLVPQEGWLKMGEKNKLTGCGLAFFYSQMLTGDVVDNVPGLPGCGPVKAYKIITEHTTNVWPQVVCREYAEHYGDYWEDRVLEQGRLLWMTRRLNEDGTPVLWEIGMTE